jgi:hypothetical protein
MNPPSPSIGLRGLIAAAIFGALVPTFSAASAADPSSARVIVKYSELNIARRAGSAAALRAHSSGGPKRRELLLVQDGRG